MGDVLFELDQILRSKQHQLTLQESKTLMNCKSKAIKDYTVGAILGGGVSWIATSRFSLFGRMSISAGASTLVGLWTLANSLESCVNHILAMNGSQMQRELANLVVTKYNHHPQRMQRISRHFYSEQVYDDSSPDQAKIRWRYRNFYSDNANNGQKTQENESYSDYESDPRGANNSHTQSDTRAESDRVKFDSKPKQGPINSEGGSATMDPLDCFFGYPAMEEIGQQDSSTAPPKVNSRRERRAHRKRRLRHREAVLSPQPI